MRKRRVWSMRRFRCPECGTMMSAAKVERRATKGHVKTMYCWVCKGDRDFVQVDTDRTK